ncbi:hypothetical protein DFH06DRAFT_1197809 [Mycena polygramma]|nr:hypothetical protein DFH06DRAFT_1197809 [Mycena polygramma]
MSLEQDDQPSTTESLRPESPADQFRRVEELWFRDGTLVLVAGSSLFRVYRGQLAKRSSVFNGMLEMPQPASAETIDGCPVVRLWDDERDLGYFLNAIFDYEFFAPFPAKTTFDIIAGVIRLSTKYEVASLRKRALQHLASAFPFRPVQFPGRSSWKIPNHEWIRVVLFAREMSIDWILPVAFYRVVEKSTPAQLLNGIDIDDVHFELAPADKLVSVEQSLAICGSASSQLTHFLLDRKLNSACPGLIATKYASDCLTPRLDARMMVEARRTERVLPMTLWMQDDWANLLVCSTCKSAMKVAHEAALDAYWTGLPARFGLPEWEVLEIAKEADLA